MAKKDTLYKQVALQQGQSHHMAWIPEKFAVLGKYIKIKRDDNSWDDGWKVIGGCDTHTRTSKEADEQSQLYKKTRKASDI